jgi:hypothetical protein
LNPAGFREFHADTGKFVGRTPLKVELRDSDLDTSTTGSSISIDVSKPGFLGLSTDRGLGFSGLESGKTYTEHYDLKPLR